MKLYNICKTFCINGDKIDVLKDITAVFPKGEISVVAGKSGCGKTTLLKIAAGLENASSGYIDMEGGTAGCMFQEPRLMPWLTVKENISFSSKKSNHKKVNDLLNMLNISDFANALPSQISGGMAQRTALGRLLYYDPDIILLDEPMAALDYFTRKQLQNDIMNLQTITGKTAVLVTHDLDEAIHMADNIFVMSEGKFKEIINIQRNISADKKEMHREKILSLL